MPSQAQTDEQRSFERRIEGAFASREALGALRAEVQGADVEDFQRDRLLGRIAQYLANIRVADEAKLHREGGSDGRAGGSES